MNFKACKISRETNTSPEVKDKGSEGGGHEKDAKRQKPDSSDQTAQEPLVRPKIRVHLHSGQ